MRHRYYELNEAIENKRTGRKGKVVGHSRCTDEIMILYEGEKKAVFEDPDNLRKCKK